MNTLNSWAPVAVIIVGYAVGLYFQNKRLDDFKDGLYRFLDAKFTTIDFKFETIDRRWTALEGKPKVK